MYDETLFHENIKLVYWLIRKYYPQCIYDDDVIQSGMIGLWKASKSYDPEKSKFATYAVKCILNEIKMHFRRESRQKRNVEVSLDELVDISNEGDEVSRYDLTKDLTQLFCMDTYTLTDTELSILHLKSKGYRDAEIGSKLNLSQSYVCRVKNHAYSKIADSIVCINDGGD